MSKDYRIIKAAYNYVFQSFDYQCTRRFVVCVDENNDLTLKAIVSDPQVTRIGNEFTYRQGTRREMNKMISKELIHEI